MLIIFGIVIVGALIVGCAGSAVGYWLAHLASPPPTMTGMAALVITAAIGSAAVGSNTALIARKIVRDRMIAEQRVGALYRAVTRTTAEIR